MIFQPSISIAVQLHDSRPVFDVSPRNTVVSFVSWLFSGVTILLAFAVLRERLGSHQAIGIISIISWIAIVGYFL
jgi:hypothetical protein